MELLIKAFTSLSVKYRKSIARGSIKNPVLLYLSPSDYLGSACVFGFRLETKNVDKTHNFLV